MVALAWGDYFGNILVVVPLFPFAPLLLFLATPIQLFYHYSILGRIGFVAQPHYPTG